jgi:hypothetical protein
LAPYEEDNEYDFGAHIKKEMRLENSIERGRKENICLTCANRAEL